MTRDTSMEAYHRLQAEGFFKKWQIEVLTVLDRHGPMTRGEIWVKIRQTMDPHVTEGSISPRPAELKDMKLIHEVGRRPCERTGFNCYVWGLTHKDPVPVVNNQHRRFWIVGRTAFTSLKEAQTYVKYSSLFEEEIIPVGEIRSVTRPKFNGSVK